MSPQKYILQSKDDENTILRCAPPQGEGGGPMYLDVFFNGYIGVIRRCTDSIGRVDPS